MNTQKTIIYNNYSDSILLPSLIKLDHNLIMASFHLMKLMPAKYVLEKALREGRIDRNCPIIETSSGTYALGVGIVCAELGIPFHIISDPVIDEDLQRRLKDLGGQVQILTQALSAENPQLYRLNILQEMLAENKECYWPSQYHNIENQHAYSLFAEQLLENIGQQFTLVGAVGSGSSTCGTITYLRQTNQHIQLVGVDTFGSILFGLPNGKRLLRGLGNSILPNNLNHSLFDQVHWVSAPDAFKHTRFLHTNKGCFHGPTTGATYQVAKWIAKQNHNEMVVFIGADSGHRYQSTVYNNDWLNKIKVFDLPVIIEPKKVNFPNEANLPWACVDWNRRTYEVMTSEKNK